MSAPAGGFRPLPWVLSLGFLHLLCSHPLPWEAAPGTPAYTTALRQPSPDLLLVLAIGWLLALCGRTGALRLHALSLATLFSPLYRLFETVVATAFQRPFDPFLDLPEAAGLPHLLLQNCGPTERVAYLAGTALAALLLYLLVFWSLRTLVRGARPGVAVAALVAVQLLVLASWAEGQRRPQPLSTVLRPSYFAAALADLPRGLHALTFRERMAARIAAVEQELAAVPGDLARLRGTDVWILFLESYGRCLFREPASRAAFDRWAPALQRELAANGFTARSAFCFPEVQGGASRFAHAQLLSGVRIGNAHEFALLMAKPRDTLPRRMTARGWTAVNVQPAMTVPWPKSQTALGFSSNLFQQELAYGGRAYAFGRMPDQFALWQVVERRDQVPGPLLVHYVSVSGHGPFARIPPYHQDWSRCADPRAFDVPAKERDITWANYTWHDGVEAAYLDAMEYGLKVAVGLTGQLQRPSLVLVLGDHQPPPVGALRARDSSPDVPFHVFANRPELLKPFAELGFVAGITPPDNGRAFSSAEFLSAFLRWYSGG